MVELDDVRLGNYFIQGGKRIEITREHYPRLLELCEQLEPFRIVYQKLSALGFERVHGVSNEAWTKACNGIPVYLRAVKNKRFVVQLGNIETLRTIEYIHELQNVWYWFFAEPLQRPADKQKPALEKKNVITTPKKIFREEDAGPVFEGYKPQRVYTYYLTWDCQFIISTNPQAVWQVTTSPALFEYENRPWGLQLILGQATNLDDDRAAAWLQTELRQIPGI